MPAKKSAKSSGGTASPVNPPSLTATGLEDDFLYLVDRYCDWTQTKARTFGPWGPYFRFDPERIADAVEVNSEYLSWVTGEANAFKRAACLMLALERSEILVLTPNNQQDPWPQDDTSRVLEVANASAALDIAVYAAMEIADADASTPWALANPPRTPSLHVFAELVRTVLIAFRLSQCGKRPPCGESVVLLVTSIGLLLETSFYRTNPGIAGQQDDAFLRRLIGDGLADLKGLSELLFMDMRKYADDPGDCCPPWPFL